MSEGKDSAKNQDPCRAWQGSFAFHRIAHAFPRRLDPDLSGGVDKGRRPGFRGFRTLQA
jgi:hypothetical protein